ncbi:MAG: DedA family protein [Chloroflexi bacterium]|nr:DedA family protein [Chloroflexota bacterium]
MAFGVPDFGDIVEFLKQYYSRYGYFFVSAGAFLENTAIVGLIFPGGTMVLLGSFYAKLGVMSLPLVWLLGSLGTFAGASLDYSVGRLGVYRLIFRIWKGQKLETRFDAACGFMNKYGLPSIFLAHFVGHVRSFIAITAGTTKLPYRRFVIYEGLAALAWNGMYCLAGYLLARNLVLVQQIYTRFGLAIAGIVILWLIVHLSLTGWRKHRQTEAQASEPKYFGLDIYLNPLLSLWKSRRGRNR